MIGLIQNETLYEYDIRSLILAFCIGEKIELSSGGDDNSIYDFICRVFYGEEETLLELRAGESVISEKVRGDFRDKRNFKNSLKAALYRLLSCYFQKELPWGTLNGIRPTKLVFEDCLRGKSRADMQAELCRDYLVSRRKGDLCVSVGIKETELLKNITYESRIQSVCGDSVLSKYMPVLFFYVLSDFGIQGVCRSVSGCPDSGDLLYRGTIQRQGDDQSLCGRGNPHHPFSKAV